jgi:DNA transformation protein
MKPRARKPTERILPFREQPDAPRSLQSALNLGAKSSAWLQEIGLTSLEEVRALGPIEVCRRLHAGGRPVSALMAYALEGALTGCHWNAIPWETKEFLAAEFAQMKRQLAAERKSATLKRTHPS